MVARVKFIELKMEDVMNFISYGDGKYNIEFETANKEKNSIVIATPYYADNKIIKEYNRSGFVYEWSEISFDADSLVQYYDELVKKYLLMPVSVLPIQPAAPALE